MENAQHMLHESVVGVATADVLGGGGVGGAKGLRACWNVANGQLSHAGDVLAHGNLSHIVHGQIFNGNR